MSTKIFVVYHKVSPIFRSEIFEPIQTGCANTTLDLGLLKDNTGDNISHKNQHYGELSAWYWVWKNYLPAHPEVDYVGFCHYRRFLDFFSSGFLRLPFAPTLMQDFKKRFRRYSTDRINKILTTADVFLPQREHFFQSVLDQFAQSHPVSELNDMHTVFVAQHPSDEQFYEAVFSGYKMYTCLNFVMRREYFIDLCEWMFSLMFEYERNTNLDKFQSYDTIRLPAFIAERLLTVWILSRKMRIRHVNSFLLYERQIPVNDKHLRIRRTLDSYVLRLMGR